MSIVYDLLPEAALLHHSLCIISAVCARRLSYWCHFSLRVGIPFLITAADIRFLTWSKILGDPMHGKHNGRLSFHPRHDHTRVTRITNYVLEVTWYQCAPFRGFNRTPRTTTGYGPDKKLPQSGRQKAVFIPTLVTISSACLQETLHHIANSWQHSPTWIVRNLLYSRSRLCQLSYYGDKVNEIIKNHQVLTLLCFIAERLSVRLIIVQARWALVGP